MREGWAGNAESGTKALSFKPCHKHDPCPPWPGEEDEKLFVAQMLEIRDIFSNLTLVTV